MKNKQSQPLLQEVTLPRGMANGPRLQLPPGIALLGCAPGALGVLGGLSIAVIGCGSVGGRIALLLTRMGIGGLLLVDPKSYKTESLATHHISPEEVGQPKALAVARRCKAIKPALRVLVLVGRVESLELAALAGVDLIVMAPDRLPAEMAAGQLALWLKKHLVQASVHGSTLTAQVRFFGTAKADGACPACGYGRAERELLMRDAVFSCEGATGADAPLPDKGLRTNSIAALCSLCADLAAIQILRFFLNLGQPVAGSLLELNGYTQRTLVTNLTRNPACVLEHRALTQALVELPLGGLSLAQLTQQATGAPVTADTQFEVAGLDWVEFAACGCAQPTPVRQFVPRGRALLGRCRKCSQPLAPLNFYTHRTVSASVLGSAAERPLNKLGARRVSSVLLRTGDLGVLVRQQTATQTPS